MISREKKIDPESLQRCNVLRLEWRVNWFLMFFMVVIETVLFMLIDTAYCDECGTSVIANGLLAVVMVGIGCIIENVAVLVYSCFLLIPNKT